MNKNSDIKKITEEVHRQAIRHFPTRKVIVYYKNEIWSADLVFMRKYAKENNGVEYLLTVIDCFTRYAWCEPLINKTAQDVEEAFIKIFKKTKSKPKFLWVDRGSEFVNKDFKEFLTTNKITLYHTNSLNKASIIERFNRTLKNKMFKLFTLNQGHEWVKDIQKLVTEYNNSFHSGINMTPKEAWNQKSQQKLQDQKNVIIYSKSMEKKPKFKIGDHVRISKYKGTFEKGYSANWSYEVFKIKKVNHTNPITYEIEDLEDEPIIGAFYEQELQKTNLDNIYVIEKKIKSRMKNGQKEWLIKWLGFPEKYNSWVKESDIN